MGKAKNHDEYLEGCAPFAVPILRNLRRAMHEACPEVVETIKWGSPTFEHHGILAGVSAFQEHATFTFWKGMELSDPEGLLERAGSSKMGTMRLEKAADLPSERVLLAYIREAARLNEETLRAPKKKATSKKAKAQRSIEAPPDLLAALKKNKRARATFEGFSYTNKKDYVEWIAEAKREATREKRIQTALEWMAEGKPRNWKYMKEWR